MRKSRVADLKRQLSRRPDILGREEYVNSAVLVPLVFIQGRECLLFEKRAAHIKQGSEICFPGGHFDRDRDAGFLETALRETREELGIEPHSVEIVGQLDTLVTPRGIIVESYLGCLELSDLGKLVLDRNEVEEVFVVPLSWFAAHPPAIYHTRVEIQSSYTDTEGGEKILLPVEELGLPARYKKNRSEWLHRVLVYRREPYIIWGLTAAIVFNLMQKVFTKDV